MPKINLLCHFWRNKYLNIIKLLNLLLNIYSKYQFLNNNFKLNEDTNNILFF